MKALVLAVALVAAAGWTSGSVTKSVFVGTTTEEYVYQYVLDVTTGVVEPEYGSLYRMKSDLHVRPDPSGNGTFVYFTEPKVFLYTGHLPLPVEPTAQNYTQYAKQAEAIVQPFYVTYDQFGLVKEVFTSKADILWSVNIKKGVASLLQLPMDKVPTKKFVKPIVFTEPEETIYGKVNVTYVMHSVNEKVHIVKTPNYDTFTEVTPEVYSNVEAYEEHQNWTTFDTMRPVVEYELTFAKDGVHVYKVHSESTKYVQPFVAMGQKQYVSTKQSLVYLQVVAPTKTLEFANFPMYHYVHYETPESMFEEHYPTLSTVTPVVEISSVGPKVQVMLYEAVQYLQENQITNQEIDTKHGLIVTRIIDALKPFTVENYGQLWTMLTKTSTPKDLMALDFFYKVLPSVGTKYSVQFVVQLVKNHSVKDSVATGMLFSLGLNVRAPSEELLHSVELLMNFETLVKPDVAHAAILTFGTMVYKTFQHDEHPTEAEKYIKVYYKHLKEAKTFEEQLVWLHGLQNIQEGSVVELLVPLAKGEQVLDLHYDRHLQVHVIYSLMTLMDDHDELFETVFPIVVDDTLPVEVRVAAVKVIASMEDIHYFTKLETVMKMEKNVHVYSYFVSTVKALMNSDMNYGTEFYHYLEHVLEHDAFVHYDAEVETKAFYYDDLDGERKIGTILHGNMIADVKHNKVNSFYISFSPYVMDEVYDLYSVYVKFEGVHNPLSLLWPKLFNVDPKTVNEPLTKNYENEPVHVEFTFMANGKAVYTKYFNEETIKQFYTYTYLTVLKTLQYQFTTVLNLADTEVYTPTFDGVPTKIDLKLPLVSQFKYNVVVPSTTNPNEVTLTVNSFFRLWMHGYYGVSVYNPFALTWQGTRRVQAFDFSVPLVFDVIYNFQQNSFKLVWTKSANEVLNVVGFKAHVKTQVYAKPDSEVDYLKATCQLCHQYATVVAHPMPKKKDVVLYEAHSKYTGLHFLLSFYDIEVPPMVKHYKSLTDILASELFIPNGHKYGTVFDYVTKYFTCFYTTFMLPKATSYGVAGYMNPCKVYPFDKVEFTFKVDSESMPHKLWTTPDQRQYVKMTAVFKKTDVIVNHWDVNVSYTHEHGTYFKTINVQVTHQAPDEKNMNICIDWVKDIDPESVTGKLKYFHGYSHDHKCVKDDMVVSIEWTGVHSDDQKNFTYTPSYHTLPSYYYPECAPRVLPIFEEYSMPVPYECAEEYTTVRKYTYTVDYQHVYPAYVDFVKPFWFWVKRVLPSYYHEVDKFHFVPESRIVVDVEYPVHSHGLVVDVVVKSAYETVAFDHIPYFDYIWLFQPDNTLFTKYFKVMKSFGYVESCVVNPVYEYAPYHYEVAKAPVFNEWILYASDHPVSYNWAVYVQKLDKNFVAFKLVLNGHSVVVQPRVGKQYEGTTHKYTFTVDSELMHAMEHGSTEGYPFKYFYVYDTVVFVVPHISLYVVYDAHQVMIETVKDPNLVHYGQCYV